MSELAAILLASLAATQTIELYRARYRPASELVPIARSALGSGGQVTLDARTATLVLNGSPQAIQRTLALLEQVDRPLRQVVIESVVRQVEDFDALGVRVAWKTSLGPLRLGTLPPLAANGLIVGVDATRARETNRASSRLRLLEGGTGIVRTGKALPVLFEPYWGTTAFVPVDTGFEAKARVLEGDRVYLELRPFAGRVEDNGELTYIAVATSITVSPGETVVLAETTRAAESSTTDSSGAQKDQLRRQQIVLITVELER
ncbi:MAG: hypothetical protein BMS9Abin37_0551 [Acidobacteriota bacterium]|nr:MAG: hypothetical protein BMS9Abin37_0551 [Acidobacteriota bacterium]